MSQYELVVGAIRQVELRRQAADIGQRRRKVVRADQAAKCGGTLNAPDRIDLGQRSEIERGETAGDHGVASRHRA
jgi:hypothetical protein